MNTRDFNIIDKIIANLRMGQIVNYVDEGNVVLDFGCGAKSYLLNTVSNKIKKGVGIDYEVISKKHGNIEYINYRYTNKLPFEDQTFDKIFLLAVLEHVVIDQVDKLFSEFRRILKNGGQIILTTPTPKSQLLLEFLAFKLKIISQAEIADHKKYYDKTDILSIAKQTKLKLVNYKLFQFGLNSRAVLEKI